ncbi:MAG: carboxymuconolactone decarboxylase family protein [Rhodospirillales bacterium]|nr:carboxymuconolactone decarboxylase family protein [Rhodospirillales bacterium]
MSRLPLTDPQDLPPFLESMHDGAAENDWSTRHCARVFAAHPDILERYLAFYYPFHASEPGSLLDSRIKELVRLRIATLNGCKTCKAARLAPGEVSEREAAVGVDEPAEAAFSARERAALALAEQMALDHHAFDDAAMSALRRHFSEAETLELMMMIGQYIGFGRMLAMLQLEETHCPIEPAVESQPQTAESLR